MKAVFIMVSALAAASAFAGEYSFYSRISFQKAAAWVPSNLVCQSGGNLYHKKKTFTEVSYCDDHNANCTIQRRELVQPIHSTAQRCAEYEGGSSDKCLKWVNYNLVQGPTARVDIYESAQAHESNASPLRSETFTIPACQ